MAAQPLTDSEYCRPYSFLTRRLRDGGLPPPRAVERGWGVSYPGPCSVEGAPRFLRGWGSLRGAPWVSVVCPGPKLILNGPASVCLFFRTISKKTDAARITKLDIEMFHREHWKPVYFGINRSKVTMHRRQCRRGSLHSCECWLLIVQYALQLQARFRAESVHLLNTALMIDCLGKYCLGI